MKKFKSGYVKPSIILKDILYLNNQNKCKSVFLVSNNFKKYFEQKNAKRRA